MSPTPAADSALSRLARDVVVTCATILAVVTPLTHLAQWGGMSFRTYAALAGLAALVVATGACVRWVRTHGSLPAWREMTPLLGVCALAALVPIVVQHATADDAVYLPSVVHALAHPADAMGFDVRYACFGERVVESPHWNVATAFDCLEGVIAYWTGVPLLGVRYIVAPPLLAALLPLAFFHLLTRLGFRDATALTGCLLLGAALLLMRETEHTPGAVALLRTYQGKFVATAVGMPFFAALTLDLARAPTRASWARLLAVATAVAGCGASSVLMLGLLAPLLLASVVVAYPAARSAGVRIAASMATAMAYAIFVAGWAYVSAADSLSVDSPVHRIYSRDFAPNAGAVFAGPITIGLMIASLACALATLRRSERTFLLVWTLGAGALLLNPLVAPFVIEHVTTPNLYWRAFYVAPLLPIVGVAGAAVAEHLRRRAPDGSGLAVGALVTALVLLQIPLQLGDLTDRSQLIVPRLDADRCLNRVVAAKARFLARTAPPGPMLAPPYLSRIVPLVGAGHPQLWHQEESIRLWAGDEVDLRFAASAALAGNPRGRVEALDELLARYPEITAVAAFPAATARPSLLATLRAHGFARSGEIGPDVVLFVRR